MSYDLLSVCMCVKGKGCCILGLFVFVYKEHTCHTWHADFVFGCLYVFACFLMFFLPSCLFAAPVCDDPCTVLNVSQRVQKAAKIKKKAVCKNKESDRRKNLPFFFTIHSMTVSIICVVFISAGSYHVERSFRSGCLGSVRASS